MPRTKKQPGTAVDRRNGRQAELSAASLAKFSLPKRPLVKDPESGELRSEPWRLETRKAWSALWSDPVAKALTPVDRPVLLRWADSIDRAARHLELGDADPIATGSMGQAVESPHYGIADKAIKVAQACEAQLGVGALNRARLGIAITAERVSLDEMNARLKRPEDAPRRADPRVVQGAVIG
jgi:hypothetical protein